MRTTWSPRARCGPPRIISNTDPALLALTPGLGLRVGEAQGIVDLYTNPADAFGKGNAVKYMGVRADDRSIYGKRSAMRGQAPVSGGRMRLSAASAAWCAAASAAVSLAVRSAIGAVPELLQHLCRQAAFPHGAFPTRAGSPGSPPISRARTVPPTVVDGDGDLWLRDRGTGSQPAVARS